MLADPRAGGWARGLPIGLRSVRVERGGRAILDGVDLDFEAGHRHVLLGASGAGKSTLLRLLNRLDDPDGGTLTVGDRPLRSLPVASVREGVGLVFQNPRPLPGTALENLLYPHLVRGRPGPDRRALAGLLDELGLDPDGLDRDVAGLSGGERQRLAIAVALGAGFEVLGLDEPTSALDPASARRVFAALDARAAADGLRTIAATHALDHAGRLGDLAYRLEAGLVVDRGPAAAVLARYDPPPSGAEAGR